MRKLKLFFACLLMAVLSIGQVWGEKITDYTMIESGKKYYIGATTGSTDYYLSVNGSSTSASIAGTAVTSVSSATAFVFTGSGTSWTIKFDDSDNYLGLKSTKDNGKLQVVTDPATFTASNQDSKLRLSHATASYSIQKNNSGTQFGSYGNTQTDLWLEEVPSADKTLSSLAVSGTPTKTSYYAGQNFDPAGLTVTGTYSDNSTAPITSGITWSYNPSQELALNQTSIGVTAIVSEITSAEYNVTGLTVTDAPAAVNYEKVTAAPVDWSGEYLIVYENGATAYVWTGVDAASCYATATISNDVIAQPEGTSSVTIASMEGGYSILVNGGTNDGKYIQNNGTSNGIKFVNSGVATTLTYENDAVTITCGGKLFRYNNASGNDRFRYFGSAQQVIQLYKKVDGTAKPSAELAYADAQKLAKLGVAFTAQGLTNPHSVTVSYASDNTGVATVDPATGAVSIVAVGKAVITASFAGNDDYKAGSASYTIFVAAQAGTAEDPLTEASAKAVIDLGCTLSAYVKGTVANVGDLNTTYGSITLTLTDGLKFFGMLNIDREQFTSNPFVIGDVVTAVGNLKKYNSTYELDTNCELVERIPATVVLQSIAISGTATELEYTDGQHFNPAGLSVIGHYSDNSDAEITDGIVWAFAPDPLTEGTTSVSVTATAGGKTSADFEVNGLTVGAAAPLSPWATVYTSNITLSTEGGTSASAAKVKFYGEEGDGYDAIKAGTGSVQGAVVVNVPAGATALHLHAYGWKGEALTLSITAPAGVTVTPSSITLNSNDGITSNSPFTLTEGSTPQTDAYYALTLSGNTAAADLTFTASSGKRFVLFGVNQVGAVTLESIAISGTATELEYNDGDHFDPAGLKVMGHYSDNSDAEITEGIVWAFDPDPLTEGTTSVSVTATAGGFTSAAFVVDGLTVAGAAPLSPWATVYTSNITLSTEGGTSASAAKVKFYGEEGDGYDAIKAGTGSVQGAVVVNVPAGATALHFHAYSWNTEDVELTITAPAGVTVTPSEAIAINKNSGIASNSPFTLAEGSTPQTDAYFAITLSGNTTATDLTFTATSGKRFVIFGVNQEGGIVPVLKSIEIAGDLTKKSGYKAGDALDLNGLTVSAIYTLNEVDQDPVDVTSLVNWSYDPLEEGQTAVTITATLEDKTDDITISDLAPVASADPLIITDPVFYLNWGTVIKGATAPTKTITVTLQNVDAATAVLGGTNPTAFSINDTEIADGDVITVSVVSTATEGPYSAKVILTDNAGQAPNKEINLSITIEDAETPVSTNSEWVPATAIEDGMEVLITGVKNDDVYAMGEQKSNNRSAVAGTLSEGVFIPGEKTMSFTLVATGETDTYYIMASNDKYLYNASTGSNSYLRTKADNEDASWTITFDGDGNAVITSVENTNRTLMRFNLNGTSTPLFNCYASGQQSVKLYVPKPAQTTYTVTFDKADGSEPTYVEVNDGDAVTEPSVPERQGYTFINWMLGENVYNFETPVTGNITLVADWAPTKYTVTFDSNGGSDVDAAEVTAGETVTRPEDDPTRDGYTFINWMLGENVYNFETPVTDNITLVADWAPTKYTVTFNSNGGSDVDAAEVTAGETVTKPTDPTRQGYTFNYWTLNGVEYNFTAAVNSDIELVANWTLIDAVYTVTFNSNGGSDVDAAEVNAGETVTKPADPTRQGYTFKYWTLNNKKYNFATPVTSDLTLVARWIVVENVTGDVTEAAVNASADVIDVQPTGHITVNTHVTWNDLNVRPGSKITLASGGKITAHQIVIHADDTKSNQMFDVTESNVEVSGDNIYFEKDFVSEGYHWYNVAVPFPVNINGGIMKADTTPLTRDAHFNFYYYDGARRAQYGRGNNWIEETGQLQPGVNYQCVFDQAYGTILFKKAGGKLNNAPDGVSVTAHATSNAANRGWNGIANNGLTYASFPVDNVDYVYMLNDEGTAYINQKRTLAVFRVGSPFFIQAITTETVILVSPFGGGASEYAPQRVADQPIRFGVELSQNGKLADRLFVTASDDAENQYVVGKDLAKFTVPTTVAQFWVNNYNEKLSANDVQLVNNQAIYDLGLYAPAAGTYSISAQQVEGATLYVTYNGAIVWNLSLGDYELDLTRGTTTGYGLLLVAQPNQMPTGLDTTEGVSGDAVQKILLNGQLYILRDGHLFDAVGHEMK